MYGSKNRRTWFSSADRDGIVPTRRVAHLKRGQTRWWIGVGIVSSMQSIGAERRYRTAAHSKCYSVTSTCGHRIRGIYSNQSNHQTIGFSGTDGNDKLNLKYRVTHPYGPNIQTMCFVFFELFNRRVWPFVITPIHREI